MTPSSVETWADITDAFELLDEELVYVDGPIEGYARHQKTGRLYAFRCFEVLRDLVRHWILVPVASTEGSPAAALDASRDQHISGWYSVIEDLRSGTPSLTAFVLDRRLP
jgi:hypothetical protein